MSISTCSVCDKYVDTDEEPMEEIDGKEVCTECSEEEGDEHKHIYVSEQDGDAKFTVTKKI